MGFFRLLFSLVIVCDHIGLTGSNIFTFNGDVALKSFFVISGFYMAIILNEKYIKKNKSYFLFITNRILRIYPIYLIVLFLFYLVYFRHLPFVVNSSVIYPIFENIIIFINPDYFQKSIHMNAFLLDYPAWTLGLEMIFYFIAPVFIRSWKKIVFVFIASIFLRYYGNHALFYDNLFYFILGASSYLLYKKILELQYDKKIFLKFFFAVSLLLIIIPYFFVISGFHYNNNVNEVFSLIYFVSFASIIPPAFIFFSKNALNNFLGEFSYPIYISHALIIYIFTGIFIANYYLGLLLTVSSVLLFSKILLSCIINPIQNFRSNRVKVSTVKK